MLGEDRVKLLLKPAFGPLQRVIDKLRALPWPAPVQRITTRGLARLKAKIPELAELLDGKTPAPRPVEVPPARPPALRRAPCPRCSRSCKRQTSSFAPKPLSP